jgi:hypothetical protein
MSSKTKSILKKKSPSTSARTMKKKVKINPENNTELIFKREFSQSDKNNLWNSRAEEAISIRESQKEKIKEQGKQLYLENNKKLDEQNKKHAKKVLDEYKLRKNIPYLAAKKAMSRKKYHDIVDDVKHDADDDIDLTFLIQKRPKYYSGGRRKRK